MPSAYRVVCLEDAELAPFGVYLAGNPWEPGAHPLASQFGRYREDAIDDYKKWLDTLPDRQERLEDLRADTECGRLPLVCRCGSWKPGEPEIRCHAVIVAKAMAAAYPQDLERLEW